MNPGLPLFDHAQAREKAQEGIELSSKSSGEEWKEYAVEFLRTYLREHDFMFCDDLWDAGLMVPPSSRALGAVIQEAVKNGWIKEIRGEIDGTILARPSKRSNMQLKRVWKSELYPWNQDQS